MSCTHSVDYTIHEIDFTIEELVPYINWLYFFHAWDFQPRYAEIAAIHGCDVCRASWLTTFKVEERQKAAEAMQLYKEATRMLWQLGEEYKVHGIFKLCKAFAKDDNLILDNTILPLLRQQSKTPQAAHYLCLSDFVRPVNLNEPDIVGIYATTVDAMIEELYANDPYKHLLVQTLADRLAEAAAEKMHQDIRTTYWGYAPNEQLSIADLFQHKFQGIRPAVGYPSLPDQSINFLLEDMLHMSNIGIQLTENGAMRPHASTSGLMLAHPQTSYFSIGTIDKEQLADYAQRRGKDLTEMKKFLADLYKEM